MKTRKKSTKKIYKKIADQNDVTREMVENKISKIINESYEKASPEAKAEWETMFGSASKPDSEVFIKKISNFLK